MDLWALVFADFNYEGVDQNLKLRSLIKARSQPLILKVFQSLSLNGITLKSQHVCENFQFSQINELQS